MFSLDGKTALVTGASQGMGAGIAKRLAKAGARVAVNYLKSEAEANAVVAEIQAVGGEAVAVHGNIAVVADIERVFADTLAAFGRLDILVNNAGIATMMPLAELTEAEYDRVFNLNAKGTLFCLKQAALHLADNGRVVNIASSTVDFTTENTTIYAGSRAAVKAYTKVAARELGVRGITVNTVTPSVTLTPLATHLPDDFKNNVIASTPSHRLGTPEDIAEVVAFLVSDEAARVTGQDILTNGGGKQ